MQPLSFTVPKIVLNYGIIRNLEIVGEFEVKEPRDENVQFADPGLFLKAVLKEGILQEREGIGFAVEAGRLLPSTDQGERKFGSERIGILSGRLPALTYHLNFGGGVDRVETNPFVLWGIILELPVLPKLRLVEEVNGESFTGKQTNNSALLGFIWQRPFPNVSIDAGIRKGISSGAADWMFTTGLTFSFSLASPAHN